MDFASHESLVKGLRGAVAMVHLVGIIGEVGTQTFERVHIDTTARLLAAARDAGVRRWVHMSALGTRKNAPARYHQTKWEAEELVRGSGLAWTILRPSIIYGPGDSFTNLFVRIARYSPVVPVIGGGEGLLQPVELEMVARSVVGAIGHPEAVGRSFDVCGPERLSLRDLIRLVLEASGQRRWLMPVPWWIARIQAALLEAVFPRLLGRPAPLTRDQLRMLGEDNVGDGAPADQAFGLRHRPLREALESWLKPRR